jgi:NAD(P)-dependent dehydrogenase (short-subunit alcohol dehydrogenase family)
MTSQTPSGSGFGPVATASDVIRGCDLTNKVAIVTGGYTGIGLETTRAFLLAGAKVIVPARDHEKATNALSSMPGAVIESLDLEGLGGVYCANCDIDNAVPADSTELFGVRPWATSPELADRLWRLSERLIGVPAID